MAAELATAKIARVRSGALADYKVELHEDVLGNIGMATLHEYPRFASSRDLVARAVALGLTGKGGVSIFRPRLGKLQLQLVCRCLSIVIQQRIRCRKKKRAWNLRPKMLF
jgi:hypothetical protein